MKHTPGPLHVVHGPQYCFHEGNSVALVVDTETDGQPGDVTVAEVWPADDGQDLIDGKRLALCYNAFPAMLEALQQIVWKLSHNFDQPDYKGPARITRQDATVRMAVDAIALATA